MNGDFQVGDTVYVEDSAQEDCTLDAWRFIEHNRKGTVMQVISTVRATGKDVQCAVDFGAEFSGGHYCTGQLTKRQGQYITAKHLSLCFEDSREVQTMPHVECVAQVVRQFERRSLYFC